MTLDEFREQTKDLPGHLWILVRGYEGGVDTAKAIEVVDIRVGYHGKVSYSGEHEVIDHDWDYTDPSHYCDDEEPLPIVTGIWVRK